MVLNQEHSHPCEGNVSVADRIYGLPIRTSRIMLDAGTTATCCNYFTLSVGCNDNYYHFHHANN